MKIRIKFKKYGPMKFIGHLDVMRYFQKAMRRAGVDICYSGGFSPHQIMSFAPWGGRYQPRGICGYRGKLHGELRCDGGAVKRRDDRGVCRGELETSPG